MFDFLKAFPEEDDSLAEKAMILNNISIALRLLSENKLNIIIGLEEDHESKMGSVIKATDLLKQIDLERSMVTRQIDNLEQQASAGEYFALSSLSDLLFFVYLTLIVTYLLVNHFLSTTRLFILNTLLIYID